MPATTALPRTAEERRAKISKVRSLRAKTVARGCTPEEAESAQLMADRLQAKYGLTDDECAPEPERRPRDDFGTWFWDTMRQADQEARNQRARDAYTKAPPHRTNRSHAGCDHEPTSSARAKCRKAGGPR